MAPPPFSATGTQTKAVALVTERAIEIASRRMSMNVALSADDIEVLLTSLEYSMHYVENAPGTPKNVRSDNLSTLEVVAAKLRVARRSQG